MLNQDRTEISAPLVKQTGQPEVKTPTTWQTCGVVLLHQPDADAFERLRLIRGQVDFVYVVDSSLTPHQNETLEQLAQTPNIKVLINQNRFGEAPALNLGVQEAIRDGFHWAIVFDQFSLVRPDFVSQLMSKVRLGDGDRRSHKVGLVAPGFVLPRANQSSSNRRSDPSKEIATFSTLTSGSLLNLDIAKILGPFNERFYIDYVGQEYYLRLLQRGYEVIRAPEAQLVHSRTDSIKTLRSSFRFLVDWKQPFGIYYTFRNRVLLYRRSIFNRPMWMIRDMIGSSLEIGHILLAEERKGRKLKLVLLGMIDGMLGRTGPIEYTSFEVEKVSSYYSSVRQEIFPLLPDVSEKLIDLGCGTGDTAAAIKAQGKAKWVGGVELNPAVAEIARKKLDMLYEGDLQVIDLPIEKESIDTILVLDILEHLVDPWKVVKKLDAYLKPGGVIVASIPNMRHLSLIIPLLFLGDWRYQDEGILDATHLRFFTRKTAVQLMTSSGLKLEEIRTTGASSRLGSVMGLFNVLTFRKFQAFFDFQYLIRVRKV